MSRPATRTLPFFIAAVIAAAPAFAHDHDGTKRFMRQMAMSEGDPQGLIAVPHSATVRAEQQKLDSSLRGSAREEDTHNDATKRHHKED